MKANELRIGNLLIYKGDGKVYPVALIDKDTFDEDGNMLEPIPLTSEILEKCGFKKRRDGEYLYSIELDKHISIVINKDTFFPMLLQDAEFSGGELSVFCCNEIKYLHQLQNLKFALTGEELEVKL